MTSQLGDLLLRAHVPYPHGLVVRACEEEGGGRSAAAEQEPKRMRKICHDLSKTNMSRHLPIDSPSQSYTYTCTTARSISRATQAYTYSNAMHHAPQNTCIILMALHAALLGQVQTYTNSHSTPTAHQSIATINITPTSIIAILLPSTSKSH